MIYIMLSSDSQVIDEIDIGDVNGSSTCELEWSNNTFSYLYTPVPVMMECDQKPHKAGVYV
jgi:hypothetical protein